MLLLRDYTGADYESDNESGDWVVRSAIKRRCDSSASLTEGPNNNENNINQPVIVIFLPFSDIPVLCTLRESM